jgi:CheY-like chemotaxis protein
MRDRFPLSVKPSAEDLLALIASDLRSLESETRLFETEQRELGLLAARVESLRHGNPSPEGLRSLADQIGNAAFLAGDGEFADLMTKQKRRIVLFLDQTAPAKEPKRVLIVEDAAPTRGLLRAALERQGLMVDAVEDEIDALASLDRARYALFIVDLTTRRVVGGDLIRRISERHAGVPVLVASAAGTAELDLPNIRALIRKPFDVNRVAQMALTLLDITDELAPSLR